jgi:hypothetical protein
MNNGTRSSRDPKAVTRPRNRGNSTCPQHTAGDLEIKREGNFLEVRCRECAREARARGEWVD